MTLFKNYNTLNSELLYQETEYFCSNRSLLYEDYHYTLLINVRIISWFKL